MRWDTHISCYPFHYRWIRYYQSANAYLKPSPTIRRIGNGIYSVILFPSRSVSKLPCWQILIRGIRRDTDGKTNRYILELWNNGYLIWYFSIFFFSLFSRNAYFRLVSKRKKVESESESQNPLLSPFWATFSLIIAKNSELLHRNIAGKKKGKIVYGYGIIPPLPVLRNERYAILKFRLREYAERPRTDAVTHCGKCTRLLNRALMQRNARSVAARD